MKRPLSSTSGNVSNSCHSSLWCYLQAIVRNINPAAIKSILTRTQPSQLYSSFKWRSIWVTNVISEEWLVPRQKLGEIVLFFFGLSSFFLLWKEKSALVYWRRLSVSLLSCLSLITLIYISIYLHKPRRLVCLFIHVVALKVFAVVSVQFQLCAFALAGIPDSPNIFFRLLNKGFECWKWNPNSTFCLCMAWFYMIASTCHVYFNNAKQSFK